ncbi:hypothetical protein NFI96_021009 [Prochilodus magdalenae]|nr:hypothetical protein NFI96_021009 [Prochilodus magdalenae]
MHFFRFLLPSLLTVLLVEHSHSRRVDCKDSCCSFVENFPHRLSKLRSSYDKIRDYYEEKDELEIALLNKTVLQKSFKSPYGCHAMNEILHFYLDTVLPTAVTENTNHFKSPINEIGNIFQDLKRDLVKCRFYLACQKPFEISSIKNSYQHMKGKGMYKAMGELDMLFNYIEDYLASKRQKQ